MRLEPVILSNLVHNEEYVRKVIPFLKPEYFNEPSEKLLYEEISSFVQKYNNRPTKETLLIALDKVTNVSEPVFKAASDAVNDLSDDKKDFEWLIEETEKFCQERAVFNAITKSIGIMEGQDKEHDKGFIPTILSDALAVSFDSSVGHDYFKNAEDRFKYYHEDHERLPFDIDIMNKITGGGLRKKTLMCYLGGTGAGKSLVMSHNAAANLLEGKNVLYLSLEMGAEEIGERIDANLLNVPFDDVSNLSKKMYEKKMANLYAKTKGRLVIKQYSAGSVGVNHFRYLLKELRIKSNFTPDVIYVDYLNLMASARLKYGSNIGSYMYVKSVAEELRGLALELDIPIITATQMNRSGLHDSDPTLENTSESIGLAATVDYMISIIRTEELDDLNQIMFKQLKNRYGDLNYYRRFVVGIDRPKMRLFNTEQSAQDDVMEDKPVMDSTEYGQRHDEDEKMGWMTKKTGRKDFSGLFS